jgi:2-polyprenyl-6-methoxyphenol hydroxylase-like FAD-dependent oxidoreductase
MKMPRVLVIGGSVGGLFAANVLRSVGCEVSVFERAEGDLAGRGAGLGTHPELHAVMRALGLAFDESLAVRVTTRACLDRDGRITDQATVPQLLTAWASIYRPLKSLLPDACYFAGMSLERIEQEARGVTAIFADGTRVRADLLIGADGIRSSVRSQFAPEIEPLYAGYIAWRGLAHEQDFSPEIQALMFRKFTMCLPEGEQMLVYPVPGRDHDTQPGHRACNFVWYRPADERKTLRAMCTDALGRVHSLFIAPPLIRPEVIAAMLADARELLAPQIVELVERTAQPFFQPIFDLESEDIVFGRVALLGDAAFVARPHAGLGVTKAALDARCLADALTATGGDVDAALARYACERLRFGSWLVARSRSMGTCLIAQARPNGEIDTSELHHDPRRALRETGSPSIDTREFIEATAK